MPRRHAAIQYQGSISTSLTDAAESGYAHPGEDRESRLHRDALPERPNCRIACCTHYKSHRWSLAMYLRPAFVACEHLLQVFAELSAVTFDGPSITVEHYSHAQWWHDAFNLMNTSAVFEKEKVLRMFSAYGQGIL